MPFLSTTWPLPCAPSRGLLSSYVFQALQEAREGSGAGGFIQGRAPRSPSEVGEAHKRSRSTHHLGRAVATDTQRNVIQAGQVLGNTGLRHELIFSPTWDGQRHHLLTEIGCAWLVSTWKKKKKVGTCFLLPQRGCKDEGGVSANLEVTSLQPNWASGLRTVAVGSSHGRSHPSPCQPTEQLSPPRLAVSVRRVNHDLWFKYTIFVQPDPASQNTEIQEDCLEAEGGFLSFCPVIQHHQDIRSIFCCSVAQVCLTLCDPMDCSTPGFPVLHHLPELAQTHVH